MTRQADCLLIDISAAADSRFWQKTHPMIDRLKENHARLVPLSGKAASPEGELLRMIERVNYDIWNNGGGNDQSIALLHLLENASEWVDHLQGDVTPGEAMALLKAMFDVHQAELPDVYDYYSEPGENDESDEADLFWNFDPLEHIDPVHLDQRSVDVLDEIIAAIVRRCDAAPPRKVIQSA